MKEPKVLIYDIETAPILAHVWGLWDNNVSLNMIESDWHVLSWSAKWLGEKKIMYADQRKEKDISNDSRILKKIWKLLDKADIVITQNGVKFDNKKLNARFIKHGFKPPSSYKNIDLLKIARKHFGFTSNKLEYMTGLLCKKKKSEHKKFPGFDLWKKCLAGNQTAWKEMEKYNKRDVTSTEELYHKLIPWDQSINFNLYRDTEETICTCGCRKFSRNGFAYTSTGKYQRFECKRCGAEVRGRKDKFSKAKKDSLKVKVS